MRIWLWAWVLLAASPGVAAPCSAGGVVHAAEIEHRRGDFRFWVAAEPAFVIRHEVPAIWPSTAPGADDTRWRYWLHDVQADRRRGADAIYSEHVYEPRSSSLLGEAGRFQIAFNPEYQRLLIHRVEIRRDGRWHDRLMPERISLARRETGFEQDLADGRVTALIVLDDVRVQDIVRMSYTVVGSNPILTGQTSDWSRLGWVNPQLDGYLRVLFDPGTVPKIHRENGAPDPVIRNGEHAVEVLLHAHAGPAIVNEQSYPVWYQPYPLAQVTQSRGWADVVAWATPLYPPVETLPAGLEAQVAAWQQIADPHDRLKAVLRTVQDEVRYFGVEMGENTHRPVAPGITWQRRYGDCKDKAYLLVALLHRLGFEAAPALVSMDRGRAVADYAPTAAAFDHVVVRTEVDGQVLWVDPTMTQQGGDLSDIDLSQYGVALQIAAGVDRLAVIEPATDPDNSISTVERFLYDEGGKDVELTISTTYRGVSADYARRTLASERPQDISRRYADYYRKRYGELSVIDGPQLDDDRERNVLTMTETYALKSPFENEGGAVQALDVYGESLQGISALPESVVRNGPLGFAIKPAVFRHEVKIEVPEAWDAAFVNEELKYASPVFSYARDLDIEDGGVNLVYEMKVDQADVMPEQVPAHLRELRQARDSLSMRLRFQTPMQLNQQEREQRLEALLKDALGGETP